MSPRSKRAARPAGRWAIERLFCRKEIYRFFVIDLCSVVHRDTFILVKQYNRNEPAQPGVKAGGQP